MKLLRFKHTLDNLRLGKPRDLVMQVRCSSSKEQPRSLEILLDARLFLLSERGRDRSPLITKCSSSLEPLENEV